MNLLFLEVFLGVVVISLSVSGQEHDDYYYDEEYDGSDNKGGTGPEYYNDDANTTASTSTIPTTTTTDGMWQWVQRENVTNVHYKFDKIEPGRGPRAIKGYHFECFTNLSRCNMGFTLHFWIWPRNEQTANKRNMVILSNGGHLKTSSGFYLMETPVGFEIGLSELHKQWHMHFNLVSGVWTHVALSFNAEKRSLCLVLDGASQSREHCVMAKDRLGYVVLPDGLDPFRDLTVWTCPKKIGGEDSCYRLANISFWDSTKAYDAVYHPKVLQSFLNVYYRGCIRDGSTLRDSEIRDDEVDCRQTCSTRKPYALYNSETGECSCDNRIFPLNYFKAVEKVCDPVDSCVQVMSNCSASGNWKVFWARGYEPVKNPLTELRLTDITEPGRNEDTMFLAVNGSDTFNIKLTLTFGGTSITTYRRVIGFERTKRMGTFTVTVNAEYMHWKRQVHHKILIRPWAQDVETNLVVGREKPPLMNIKMKMVAVSGGKTVCLTQLGDGQMKKFLFRNRNASAVFYIKHTYGKPGTYSVKAFCMNAKNTASANTTVTVSNERTEIAYEERALEYDKVDYVGVTETTNTSVLYVKDEVMNSEPIGGRYSLNKGQLYCSGVLPVSKEENYELYGQVLYQVQDRLASLKAKIRNPHLKPNDTMELEVECNAANDAAGIVDFKIALGDGTVKNLQGFLPFFGTISHKYKNRGLYTVKLEAANFVSKLARTVTAGVENPVDRVEVKAEDVKLTSDPVQFHLRLPVSDVMVKMSFGDGDAATYHIHRRMSTLNKENHDGNLLSKKINSYGMFVVIKHTYLDYKVYQVATTVKNNVSRADHRLTVQVGEKINQTFWSVDKTKFSMSESANLKLTILGGSPLNIDLHKGDGTSSIITIDRGSDQPVQVKSGQVRAWVIDEFQYGFELSYDMEGTYEVSAEVKNVYGYESNNLCPMLTVMPDYPGGGMCNFGFLEMDMVSSLNYPKHILRSQPINLEFLAELNCNVDKANRVITYSFQAYDLQFGADGKPRASVSGACGKEFQRHHLVIPPRTLPYGLFEVEIEIDVPEVSGVNEHRSVFVSVSQSPLRAFISGGDDYYTYTSENDTYMIDLYQDSHDPDVELYNMTNVQYGLWCLGHAEEKTRVNRTGRLLFKNDYVQFRHVDSQCFFDNITGTLQVTQDGKFYFPLDAFRTADPIFRVVIMKEGREAWFDQHMHIRDVRPLSGSLKLLANAAKMLEDLKSGGGDRSGLLNKMVGLLDSSMNEIKTVESLELTSGILNVVSEDANMIEVENQEKATNTADTMANSINKLKSSDKKAMQVAKDLLDSMGSMIAKGIDKDADKWSDPQSREPEKPKTEAEIIKSFETDPYDGFYLPEERIVLQPIWDKAHKEKQAKVAKGSLKSTDSLSNTFIERKRNPTDGKDQQLKGKGLELQMSMTTPDRVGKNDTTMKSAEASIHVPKGLVKPNSDRPISTKFLVSQSNPYGYDEGSKCVQSPVVSLKYEDSEGREVPVRDTKEPISLFVETKGGSSELKYFKFFPNTTEMNFHPIKPMQDELLSQSAFNASNINETERAELLNSYMMPPELTKTGTYYIGVIPYGFRFNASWENTSSSELFGLWESSYRLRVFTSGCRYWNENDRQWDASGCKVGILTTPRSTQCLCNHLTMFGADFYVPPNTIDFSTVFLKFAKLGENAAVFSFVISILVVYFGLIIWARRKDKTDVERWGALPLTDNLLTDRYHYLVQVHTSMGSKSGTDSKVSLVVTGENGDSGVRVLEDGKRKNFHSSSISNFVMSVGSCLGPLSYIRIWHDNTGKKDKASWHLSHIVLQDIQTGQKFLFIGNCWLAVEEGDGKLDRLLPASDANDTSNASYLFNMGVRKQFANEHVWLSVLWRPQRSNFTRVQRISCCVSLMFCTMIANAMFYKTTEKATKTRTEIRMGPLRFTAQELYVSLISTLIVFPINLLQVHLFRRAKPKPPPKEFGKYERRARWNLKASPEVWSKSSKDTTMTRFYNSVVESVKSQFENEEDATPGPMQRKKSGLLPHWVIYIAWGSVVCSISLCSFFTILYSLEWGREKSEQWLSAMLLSIVQDILFVQPIKIVLLVMFLSFLLHKPAEDQVDQCEEDQERIRSVLPRTDEIFMCSDRESKVNEIRRKRRMQERSRPITGSSLDDAKNYRLKELKMEAVLKDLVIYMVYLLVIMFLAFYSRDHHAYHVTKNIKQLFLDRSSDQADDPIMEDVNSIESLTEWLNNTFLDSLYAPAWNDSGSTGWRERLTVKSRMDLRMGPPRMRQTRIQLDHDCPFGVSYCWKKGLLNREDSDFTEGWKTRLNTSKWSREEKSPWRFQDALELHATPFWGKLRTYPASGYVAYFPRSQVMAKKMMIDLIEKNWIDKQTEGLLLEFSLFNPHVNLFSTVIIAAEVLPTGEINGYDVIKVFRLFDYLGSMGIFVLGAQLLYLCFTIHYVIDVIRTIKKEGREFYAHFWNMIEFSTMILRFVVIAMFILKKFAAKLIIQEVVEHEYDTYVDFVPLAYWDELYGYMMGLLVFLATMRFLRLLRFNKRMAMLGSTISLVGKRNHVFIAVILLLMLSFGHCGYLMFGQHLDDYRDVDQSFLSLFNFMLNKFDFETMQMVNGFLGPLFFFGFAATMVVLVAGIFITLVNDSIAVVKEDVSKQSNEYEIVDFMMKKFNQHLEGLRRGFNDTLALVAK